MRKLRSSINAALRAVLNRCRIFYIVPNATKPIRAKLGTIDFVIRSSLYAKFGWDRISPHTWCCRNIFLSYLFIGAWAPPTYYTSKHALPPKEVFFMSFVVMYSCVMKLPPGLGPRKIDFPDDRFPAYLGTTERSAQYLKICISASRTKYIRNIRGKGHLRVKV